MRAALYIRAMQTILAVLPYVIIATLAAVVVTLISGLFAMTRSDHTARRSNKIMWLRVGLQATAVAEIVVYLLLRNAVGA
jgi:hypothetical protein